MKASGVIGEGSDSFPIVEEFEAKKRGIRCAVYYKLLKLTPTSEVKISAAVGVLDIGTISTNSSEAINVFSTPRMKIASNATSVMSVLSSIATEKAINFFILFFNWLFKFVERSEILVSISC